MNQGERSRLGWPPVSVFDEHMFLQLEDRVGGGVGQEKETSCQQQRLLENLLIAGHLLLGLRRKKKKSEKD